MIRYFKIIVYHYFIPTYIYFTVRPVISVPEPRIRVRPGEDVSLECNFEFYPRGLIWWERESGMIKKLILVIFLVKSCANLFQYMYKF